MLLNGEKKVVRMFSADLFILQYWHFKIGIGKYRQLIQFPPKRNPAAPQFELDRKLPYLAAKLI